MNESETNELEMLRRRVKELELDAEQPTTRGHKRVIQIIAGKKIYFCRTSEEEMIFSENNPGVETETFHIELLNSTAEKYLNESLDYDASDSQVWYNLAGIYVKRNNYEKALDLVNKALSLKPNYPEAVNLQRQLQSTQKTIK